MWRVKRLLHLCVNEKSLNQFSHDLSKSLLNDSVWQTVSIIRFSTQIFQCHEKFDGNSTMFDEEKRDRKIVLEKFNVIKNGNWMMKTKRKKVFYFKLDGYERKNWKLKIDVAHKWRLLWLINWRQFICLVEKPRKL